MREAAVVNPTGQCIYRDFSESLILVMLSIQKKNYFSFNTSTWHIDLLIVVAL